MSRTAALAALAAAVAADLRYKVVERADLPILAQKLPSAAIIYEGDESSGGVPLAEARIYRFVIRLYVRLGNDLRVTQDQLLQLVDTLDINLDANRVLTPRTEIISRADGSIEPLRFAENGPDLLSYSMTVRIEVRPARDLILSDGGAVVTITDISAQSVPLAAGAQEYLSDDRDMLVGYHQRAPELVRAAGRVGSAAEARLLARWCAEEAELSYTDIDGLATTAWRIAGSPAPRLDRILIPSAGYNVDVTLWRIV